MKIGIIVYSQTGNAYSVALKLKEKLTSDGKDASIEHITITGKEPPTDQNINFNQLPDVSKYDALIFAAPVQAFSLCRVMAAYFKSPFMLSAKKIACFTTMQLPFSWMGGKNAIAQMKKSCTSKGGTVCGEEIVNWSNKRREQQISDLAENFSKLF